MTTPLAGDSDAAFDAHRRHVQSHARHREVLAVGPQAAHSAHLACELSAQLASKLTAHLALVGLYCLGEEQHSARARAVHSMAWARKTWLLAPRQRPS
jgi:hypothetical protein